MNREEAKNLLYAAREGAALASRALDPFLSRLLIVWGAVYALGYGFFPDSRGAWALLIVAGFALSFYLGGREARHLRTSAGRKLALLWGAFGLNLFALMLAGEGFGSGRSLAINLLVALAWMGSGVVLEQSGILLAGAVFALANALVFALVAALYFPMLAGVGCLALLFGLFWGIRGLR